MIYTGAQLIERMKQLSDFKIVPIGYHIIGVQSDADTPNAFDDTFNLFYNEDLILTTSGTTNPGTPILKGGFMKYNKDGAAVVEVDRIYYGVWKFRKHQGKIDALCQWWPGKTQPITIYRDGDGDDKAEQIGKKTSGYYGINFHPDQYDASADIRDDNREVGMWSAGCQVCNVFSDYAQIIEKCKNQDTITYTLLKEFSI